MVFDRKTLVIPDKTRFEGETIVTSGDIVIGDRSLVRYGVKTEGRIFIGEHVIIDGGLESTGDARVDTFSTIGGNVSSEGNVYLGEKVKIKGKLSLHGDLDVGDNVDIAKGFEAKGWINIRSPIPVVIYIFIYLFQLLKMGHSEEIERILKELEENQGEPIPIAETFLFIPNNSIIGSQKSRVEGNLAIGKHCQILGNYDILGNAYIDDETEISGSIEATGEIRCNKKITIHGNLSGKGPIHLDDNVHIIGNVSGTNITLSKTASVDGTLLAPQGISFLNGSKQRISEKVKRFETNADIVDEMKELLE